MNGTPFVRTAAWMPCGVCTMRPMSAPGPSPIARWLMPFGPNGLVVFLAELEEAMAMDAELAQPEGGVGRVRQRGPGARLAEDGRMGGAGEDARA